MTAHKCVVPSPGLLLVATILAPWAALAQQTAAPPPAARDDSLELAKKTQNPIADLISLPFQNNLNFGYGAKDAPHSSSTQYVLNIQPVVPVKVAKGWNLITRPIIPVIRQPDLIDGGETWGLADIQLQTYLSPSGGGKVTWGIGPVLQFPSATNGKKLGTEKWSAGPGLVALTQPGKWVIGGLVNNLWSFAGDIAGAGVVVGTSTAPGEGGVQGQIFIAYVDDDARTLLASSFEELLARYFRELQEGTIDLDELR
jgi:hypothetical protein